MALLTETKAQVDQQYGSSAIAKHLLGRVFNGEQAYRYDLEQFQVIIGFCQNIARFSCFTKAMLDEQGFAPEDVESCLIMIAPAADWKNSTDSATATPAAPNKFQIGGTGTTREYKCAIKDTSGNNVDVYGWHRSTKGYLFAYCPVMLPPQPAIGASPIQLNKNIED